MILFCAVLVCITSAVYFPTLSHPFADYDDDNYVTANAHVRSGLNWQSFAWALTATEKSNWHPLTWISHQLDFQFYGLNATGHHLTSLALHVVNVVLLFLVLSFMTRAPVPSFVVALLFAVHPLNVESVVWIAERKNVLSAAFFLAGVGAYAYYAKKPSVARYGLLTSLFVFGLASKPMVITLPCVLLLLDYWPLQRVRAQTRPSPVFPVPQQTWQRLWLEKLPLFALCIVSAWLTIYAQGLGGSIMSLTDQPFEVRLRTASWAYGEYLWKTVWPVALAPHYPHPGHALAFWRVALASLVLVSISLLVWIKRSSAYLWVGWCWFLGTLVPVIGLVQVGNQAIADRYAYLPIIGLLVALVWATADVLRGLRRRTIVGAVLVTTLSVALAWRTHEQIGFWKSSVDLWSRTLEVTKDNALAENNLGVALMGLGRENEGMAHFQNAERIDPADPTSRLNIAVVLEGRGRIDAAIRELQAVIQLTSRNPAASANSKLLVTAYADLGTVYGQIGDYSRAREAYQQALAINPLALEDMIGKFYRLVSVRPTSESYILLGEMLELTGRSRDASAAYRKALKLDPDQAEAARSLNRLGQ